MGELMETPAKKLLPIFILKVLHRYTDQEHRLSQKDIQTLVERDYMLSADRKSIRRNIDNLIEAGYPIECNEQRRIIQNAETGEAEESVLLSDFWLERKFSDGELRLIIDSLLFSQHIPARQRKDLIGKLAGLSNRYFQTYIKHIHTAPSNLAQSPQLFLTIELIDEAISKKRKVAFHYMAYGTDKKLHKRRRKDGAERWYQVTPYQMATKNDRYYLICNNDNYDELANYRIDRIADLEIIDEPARDFKTLKDAKGGSFDLNAYMEEHIYMYASPNASVKFKVEKRAFSDVVDEFGLNIDVVDEDAEYITVRAYVNERSMQQFAKNFSPQVIILEPRRLVDAVVEDARKILEAYGA